MIIDAGVTCRLNIDQVFEGEAVVLRDRVACVPNRAGLRPEAALGGQMDGEPVFFSDAREEPDGGGLWSWRWRRHR